MPPLDGQETPQPAVEPIVAPETDVNATAPDAEGAEPAPEPTLEEARAAWEAEKAELQAQLDSEKRGSSAKDRALARTRDERDRIDAERRQIADTAARDRRLRDLRAAAADPDEALRLAQEDLDRAENPPPPSADEQSAAAVIEANKRTHASHRARLGITDAEEDEARRMAAEAAWQDGREAPDFTEVMAAESQIAGRRTAATPEANTEVEALKAQIAERDEELEALRGSDAGDRLRARGGPEERIPSGKQGKTFKSEDELRLARARKEITLAEYQRLLPQFQPVARRI